MGRKFSNLLSPLILPNGMVLKNRMTAGAATNNMIQGETADYPTADMFRILADRAKNGASIVTVTGIKEAGNEQFYRIVNGTPAFTLFDLSDASVRHEFSKLAECVHMHNTKIILQLIPKAMNDYDVSAGGTQLNFGNFKDMPEVKELTKEMLDEIKDSMIEWAVYAQDAAFDGIALHMCYDFSTAARMLNGNINRRTDEYGGSTENRCRWAREILTGIRETCGKNFLIEAVISGDDPRPGGWKAEETVQFAKMTEGIVDILQIRNSEIDPHHPSSYQREKYPNLASCIKVKEGIGKLGINMAVETIGGYNDPNDMEEILSSGQADLIGSARIWISNPQYGKLIRKGDDADVVPCLRCNKCHSRSFSHPQATVCSVNPVWGIENQYEKLFDVPEAVKDVAVVGGGPAGMKAALQLAERGHKITLFEKTDRLGGLLNTTDDLGFKWTVTRYKNWITDQVLKNPSITVRFQTEVKRKMLEQGGFDAVVIGIGSEPIVPRIPGVERGISCVEMFKNPDQVDENVVIIGGGEVGVDAGMYLAETGHNVLIIEALGMLAASSNIMHTYSHLQKYWEALPSFHYSLNSKVTEITANSVKYVDETGTALEASCGTVLYAVGMSAKKEEALKMVDVGDFDFYLIGDCGDYGGDIQRCNRSAVGAANCI